MSSEMSMQVDGLEELIGSFEDLTRKYPDKAAELLVKQAKELRKDVVSQVKNDTDTDRTSKKSLAKTGSYEISPVHGYGSGQYVEISAKSPHFHLLENGHMNVVPKTRTIKVNGEKRKISLTNGGSAVGFTPGYHFMDAASRKRQIAIPEGVEKMVNQLLREEGLI